MSNLILNILCENTLYYMTAVKISVVFSTWVWSIITYYFEIGNLVFRKWLQDEKLN